MPSEALISPIGEEVLQKTLLCKYNNILFMREIVIVYAPRTQFNMPIRSHYYFEWIKFCKLNRNA